MPPNTPPKQINPLWIISLFLGLTELTIGIATTQATGWIQGLFAIFAVVFPTGVAAIFFGILWKRPYVLYAPKDFSNRPTVSDFVAAMSSSTDKSLNSIESIVRDAITSSLSSEIAVPARQEILEAAIEHAYLELKDQWLEVELWRIHYRLGKIPFRIQATKDLTISELLDDLYAALSDYIEPYTYGESWTLKNYKDNHIYRDMGRQWAQKNLDSDFDYRSIDEVGIQPGVRLIAIRLPETR
ncbi:hypothetical protein ABZW49_03600 [Nonomuraea wenchangensis]